MEKSNTLQVGLDLELDLYVEDISEQEHEITNFGCCWTSGSSFGSASSFGSCAASASSGATASCSC